MSNKNSFNNSDYKIEKKDILFQGNFLRLTRYAIIHRLFNGGMSNTFNYEVLERKSAVAILPYDPVLDRVILIEQFRPGALADPKSPWLLEIPAGVIDKNELPDEVAYREMKEEAGCEALDLHPIFEFFVSPGGSNEYLHLYCSKVDASTIEGIHGLAEENEDIRVLNLLTDEALEKMYSGTIKTVPALVALLWLQVHRKKLQEIWL